MSNVTIVAPERLRQRFKLETFVETGCYWGESLQLATLAGFAQLYSCDLNSECVTFCRNRFRSATIVEGESTALLTQHLPALNSRTLFWLDAHFAGVYGLTETAENRYPLPEELRLIRQHKPGWEHDVIAFDDLRVIRDRHNPRYRPGELHGSDANLYMDVTLASLYVPFAATHSLQLFHEGEGAAALLPYS